jgi:hypothetical protein
MKTKIGMTEILLNNNDLFSIRFLRILKGVSENNKEFVRCSRVPNTIESTSKQLVIRTVHDDAASRVKDSLFSYMTIIREPNILFLLGTSNFYVSGRTLQDGKGLLVMSLRNFTLELQKLRFKMP